MKQKKCPSCSKLLNISEFEWLPKQHRFHEKCSPCTKEISLRNDWKVTKSKKK